MTGGLTARAWTLARTGLVVAIAPLGLAACADGGPTPPMALNADATSETAPPEKPDVVPVVGDLPPSDESAARCDDGTAKQKIDDLQGNVAALTAQLNEATAQGNGATARALQDDIARDLAWIDTLKGLKPCPPPQTAASTGPQAAPAAAPAASGAPAMMLGALPIMGASAQIGYAHNFPSAGPGSDAFVLGGQTLIGNSSYGLVGGPKGGATPWWQGDLELQGAWGETFASGATTSAGQFTAAYLMNVGSLRIGPVGSYQGSTTGGFSMHTSVYGGFLEDFLTEKFSVIARGGGFSTDSGFGGYNVGGGLKANPTPALTLSAFGDYAQWRSPSDFFQYQVTAQAEYQPCPKTPLSVYAGYSFQQSGYTDFPAYHPSNNEVFVGIRVFANAPPVMTLEDRERNGPVIGLIPNF